MASTGGAQGIVVPQEAVLIDGTKPYVWVVEDGGASPRHRWRAKAVWLMAAFRKAIRLS